MPSNNSLKNKANLLKILSHPVRLLILKELAGGVKCVGEMEELLSISQSNISQHLAVLRHNQILDCYENGTLRCYYLKMPELVKALFAFLEKEYPIVERSKEDVKMDGQRRKQMESACAIDTVAKGRPLQEMNHDEIKQAVSQRYSQVATSPQDKFNFPVGRKFAESVGYAAELLDSLPAGMYESFTGAGNPQRYVNLAGGETLLDLGFGAGLDLYLYARKIGASGKVYGLDISQEMLNKTRRNLTQMGINNFELFCAPADRIPLSDASVDIVTSNGIYNLSPDKEAVLREVFRVLKPGGRTVFAEIVLQSPLEEEVRKNIEDWFRCIGGALPESDFLALMQKIGFLRIEVLSKARNARCGHKLAICANIRAYKP